MPSDWHSLIARAQGTQFQLVSVCNGLGEMAGSARKMSVNDLPPEILIEIFDYLEKNDLLHVRLSSKHFVGPAYPATFENLRFHFGGSSEGMQHRVTAMPKEVKDLITGIALYPRVILPEEWSQTQCIDTRSPVPGQQVVCSCPNCMLRTRKGDHNSTSPPPYEMASTVKLYADLLETFLSELGHQIKTIDIDLGTPQEPVEVVFVYATAEVFSRSLDKAPNLTRLSIRTDSNDLGPNLAGIDKLTRPRRGIYQCLPIVEDYVRLASECRKAIYRGDEEDGLSLLSRVTEELHISSDLRSGKDFTYRVFNNRPILGYGAAPAENYMNIIRSCRGLSIIHRNSPKCFSYDSPLLERIPTHIRKLKLSDVLIDAYQFSNVLQYPLSLNLEQLDITNSRFLVISQMDAADEELPSRRYKPSRGTIRHILMQLSDHCHSLTRVSVAAVGLSGVSFPHGDYGNEILEKTDKIPPKVPGTIFRRPLYTPYRDDIDAFSTLRDLLVSRRRLNELPEDPFLSFCVEREYEISRLMRPCESCRDIHVLLDNDLEEDPISCPYSHEQLNA